MALAMKSSLRTAGSALRTSSSVNRQQLRRSAVVVRAERKFSDSEWDAAIKKATSADAGTPAAPSTPAPAAVKAVSLGDAMAFSGPVPETVNGRLAMLGFLAAVGAELASGETVFQQVVDAPGPILGAFFAFALASLVPILKGADLKEAFGPFTPSAELTNGRFAMMGLAAVLALEYFSGKAFF